MSKDKMNKIEISENDLRIFEMQQQTDHMKLSQLQLLISASCITVNEVRERFGLSKLEHGGDVLVGTK